MSVKGWLLSWLRNRPPESVRQGFESALAGVAGLPAYAWLATVRAPRALDEWTRAISLLGGASP